MNNEMYTLKDLPKIGDAYYFVAWDTDLNGNIISDLYIREETFIADSIDFPCIGLGTAFKTYEAAEREKYNVYKGLTGKEWESNV